MSDQVTRLNAALEGRYRVERELGEGGMATVYLAREMRHKRDVALKVLKPELAAAVGRDRFLTEIETTANLQHPHILPLHDSGEVGGILFYTMPYVEGETLRQRLERERRLPVEEAVQIARDVAEALQVAHEQNVVHRDIKPSNILLSRGKAIVADFGIAWVSALPDGTRLTSTGSSIGTAGYMSPEQASGDSEVDYRADIYSLGCVLFEMLAGEQPYRGSTFIQVLAKQATAPVPAVRTLRSDVPAELDQAVTRSLAKNPRDRFESATAFAAALVLRSEGPEKAANSGKTVVVLPFANRSGDPDNEYFSDGLTEEVISDLSGVSALRVISRNSSMALKGTTKDTPTLARELGVTHLVTGSVRRAGNALRVTAELVEASTDSPIWNEKFTGTVEDVFGIQEMISRQIVSALKVTLTDTEDREVSERPINDPVAHDCYLRARQVMYDWTRDAQRRALRLVDEALGIVGESPLLLATKGQIHWNMVNISLVPADEGLPLATELVDHALALDPDCYLAIFVRGLVSGMRGRTEAALVDIYRAHELRPGDANVLVELARYSIMAGLQRHGPYAERLLQLDPLTPIANNCFGGYHWMYGRQDEMVAYARRGMELASRSSMLHVISAWWLAIAGHRDEASDVLASAGAEIGDDVVGPLALFLGCALVGDQERAAQIATPELEEALAEVLCLLMSEGYALLDRRHDAIRMLRRAVDRGLLAYPYLSSDAPFLENVRGEPDFQLLMAEVKPRWEAVVEWERAHT